MDSAENWKSEKLWFEVSNWVKKWEMSFFLKHACAIEVIFFWLKQTDAHRNVLQVGNSKILKNMDKGEFIKFVQVKIEKKSLWNTKKLPFEV